MHYVDVSRPERVARKPDDVAVLASGNLEMDEFVVCRVELRLYEERRDDTLGVYSLITSFVDTDAGSVEMTYDEGYRGSDILNRTARFVTSNLGLSALVLRSTIALREHVAGQDKA